MIKNVYTNIFSTQKLFKKKFVSNLCEDNNYCCLSIIRLGTWKYKFILYDIIIFVEPNY